MFNRVLSALAVLVMVLPLWGFVPFSHVKNVCPACPQPNNDVVVLAAGTKITCQVVAQNPEYYIVDRFGEKRAVPKSKVSSVKWRKEGGQPDPAQGVQVILKNGLALVGKIVEQSKGRYLVLRAGKQRHVVWLHQTAAVYGEGLKQFPAQQ